MDGKFRPNPARRVEILKEDGIKKRKLGIPTTVDRVIQQYIQDGYVYAVDMDLEKYFDTINHSKLIEILSRTIKDGRELELNLVN